MLLGACRRRRAPSRSAGPGDVFGGSSSSCELNWRSTIRPCTGAQRPVGQADRHRPCHHADAQAGAEGARAAPAGVPHSPPQRAARLSWSGPDRLRSRGAARTMETLFEGGERTSSSCPGQRLLRRPRSVKGSGGCTWRKSGISGRCSGGSAPSRRGRGPPGGTE